MKFYESVSIELRGNETGDEFTTYSGTDERKALEEAYAAWTRQSDFDKKHSTEEVRVYELSDDVNINDEDELANALGNCGYDVLAEADYKLGEKLTEEFECSILEKEDFAKRLGVDLGIFEEWLAGFYKTADSETKENILKRAEEISEEEID